MNIKKYDKLISQNISLDECMHLILKYLNDDLILYNFNSGFISYLNEDKIKKRFKIICSNGRFLNKNNINVITSKEIDKLSIVFMTKTNFFKENIFIDIIEKNNKNVFIYIEFDKILNKERKIIIINFFIKLNSLLKNKNWEII